MSGFIDYTKNAVEMANDQIVTITATSYNIIDFAGNKAQGKPFKVEWDAAAAEKGGFSSFMEKEIHDYLPKDASRSKLNNNFIEKKLKIVATTRNFNTLSKLIAMVDEIEQNS